MELMLEDIRSTLGAEMVVLPGAEDEAMSTQPVAEAVKVGDQEVKQESLVDTFARLGMGTTAKHSRLGGSSGCTSVMSGGQVIPG